jgi:Nucleotidyl transferase AbiEii toxin, Type IV TA system
MPSEAILAALRAVLSALAPLKLQTALLGGLALAVWKHARFTKDVDILVALGKVEKDTLLNALGSTGFRPKRADGTIRLGDLEVLQMVYAPSDALIDVQVDLLLAGDEYQYAALDRCITTMIEELDSPVNVLSCEDLILHKLLAGRIIDRADAAALLRANRDSLDFDYIGHWIGNKQITSEFSEVWAEAIPGEPLPIPMT